MRKYYSDFVRHCTRFYFSRDLLPNPVTENVNYNNYVAVSNVLDRYQTEVFNMLRFVYTSESMPSAVNQYAKDNGCRTEEVWYNIQRYEKEVATERGLI